MSDTTKEDLHRTWIKLIFTFPHEVTLRVRRADDIEVVAHTSHNWLEQQGWRRGASSQPDTDWGVDYRDDGDIAVFGFHDPNKAMLFKLTWAQYL